MSDITERLTEYLVHGGLYNSELMQHNKVRDLLIDCRAEIARLREERMTADEREALELSLELQWPKTGEQWKALAACLGPVCVAPANKHKVAIRSLLARQPLPPGPEGDGQ